MSWGELTCKYLYNYCPNPDQRYETCNYNCPWYVNKESLISKTIAKIIDKKEENDSRS